MTGDGDGGPACRPATLTGCACVIMIGIVALLVLYPSVGVSQTLDIIRGTMAAKGFMTGTTPAFTSPCPPDSGSGLANVSCTMAATGIIKGTTPAFTSPCPPRSGSGWANVSRSAFLGAPFGVKDMYGLNETALDAAIVMNNLGWIQEAVITLAKGDRPLVAMCVGGSHTAGRNVQSDSQLYTSIIRQWLNAQFTLPGGKQHVVIQKGKGSTGSCEWAREFDQIIRPIILAQKVDLIVFETGINDGGLSLAAAGTCIEALTMKTRALNVSFLFLDLASVDVSPVNYTLQSGRYCTTRTEAGGVTTKNMIESVRTTPFHKGFGRPGTNHGAAYDCYGLPYIHMHNLRYAMNLNVDFADRHLTIPSLRLAAALVCETLMLAARLLSTCAWTPDATVDSLQYHIPFTLPSVVEKLPRLFSNETFDELYHLGCGTCCNNGGNMCYKFAESIQNLVTNNTNFRDTVKVAKCDGNAKCDLVPDAVSRKSSRRVSWTFCNTVWPGLCSPWGARFESEIKCCPDPLTFTSNFKNSTDPWDLLELSITDPRASPSASGLRVSLESVHGVGFSSAVVRVALSPFQSDEELYAQSVTIDSGWEFVGRTVPRVEVLVETPLIPISSVDSRDRGPDLKLAILPCTRCDKDGKSATGGSKPVQKFQVRTVMVHEHKL